MVVNAGVTNTAEVVSFIPKDPEALEYDEDGNLIKDGRWEYTWNAENRLEKVETRSDLPAGVPDITLEFKYDYMGRRVQKVVKEGTNTVEDIRFAWNGWRMIWELDSSDVVTKVFDWGLDLSQTLEGAGTAGGLIRVQITGGSGDNWVTFPCYGGNGNVVGLAGYSTGNILAQYEYDGFGRLIRTAGDSSLAEGNPFLFSTKYMDRETGWNYYGYRYYDPDNGRWLNRDSIGEKGGFNLFAFVLNDRVSSTDKLGLKLVGLGGGPQFANGGSELFVALGDDGSGPPPYWYITGFKQVDVFWESCCGNDKKDWLDENTAPEPHRTRLHDVTKNPTEIIGSLGGGTVQIGHDTKTNGKGIYTYVFRLLGSTKEAPHTEGWGNIERIFEYHVVVNECSDPVTRNWHMAPMEDVHDDKNIRFFPRPPRPDAVPIPKLETK